MTAAPARRRYRVAQGIGFVPPVDLGVADTVSVPAPRVVWVVGSARVEVRPDRAGRVLVVGWREGVRVYACRLSAVPGRPGAADAGEFDGAVAAARAAAG